MEVALPFGMHAAFSAGARPQPTTAVLSSDVAMLPFAAQPAGEQRAQSKKVRCGECTGCRGTDCGSCANCLDKPRFGGNGAGYHSHPSAFPAHASPAFECSPPTRQPAHGSRRRQEAGVLLAKVHLREAVR